ncbi:MAG: 3-hydroxyacyl-CoA dehydrogenase family protein [Archaeoglobaceae archaeon]
MELRLENIKSFAVIGAGRMGSQIAQLLSRVGKYSVTLVDVSDEVLSNAMKSIESDLKRFFVDKGKITEDEMKEILSRIKCTTSIAEAVKKVDFVIEAVYENLELKKKVFAEIDRNAPPEAILASNTSGLSITEIASATKRAEKVVGMHFFNPVAVMRLVEVVRGALTSEETVKIVCELAKKLGKEPVVCKDIGYGFLANRAYSGLMREAIEMVWERVASPEDIDKALKLGYNLPLGPLEVGDMVGAWEIMALSEQDRIRELGPEKGRLHPLVRWMVRAGYTGGPGKKGIYDFWREVLSKL